MSWLFCIVYVFQVNQSEQSYCTIHPITCKTKTNGDFAGTEITAFVCSNVTPRLSLALRDGQRARTLLQQDCSRHATLRVHCLTTKVEHFRADIYGFTEETPGFTLLSTVKVSL